MCGSFKSLQCVKLGVLRPEVYCRLLHEPPDLVEMRAAVALSGYTRGHLRRMIVSGTLTNYGTDARPLLRAADLPRKPGTARRAVMAEAQ